MNILHTVESYYPSQHGMSEVVKQISESLIKKGHSVTIATRENKSINSNVLNGVNIKGFNISGNLVDGIKGEVESYQRFLLDSHFDIIVNFAAQQWATDIVYPLLSKISSKKVFIPTGFSKLYDNKYKKYYELMPSWMRLYDLIIFQSNNYRDINFAKRFNIKNIYTIPNGASRYEFSSSLCKDNDRLNKFCDKFLVLHVGGLTGLKGQLEAIQIFNKANINDATLLLVSPEFPEIGVVITKLNRLLFEIMYRLLQKGLISNDLINKMLSILVNYNSNKEISGKKVIGISLNRNELITAYKMADLFLFPSNIECSPIVLFEAIAGKTPFLSTNVGNAKEIVDWTGGGILLPTKFNNRHISIPLIEPSARLLENLYKNIELRTSLSKSGYDIWLNKFTWEAIADQYEKVYLSLLT